MGLKCFSKSCYSFVWLFWINTLILIKGVWLLFIFIIVVLLLVLMSDSVELPTHFYTLFFSHDTLFSINYIGLIIYLISHLTIYLYPTTLQKVLEASNLIATFHVLITWSPCGSSDSPQTYPHPFFFFDHPKLVEFACIGERNDTKLFLYFCMSDIYLLLHETHFRHNDYLLKFDFFVKAIFPDMQECI